MGTCISQKKTHIHLRKYHNDFITDKLIQTLKLDSQIQVEVVSPRFSKLYNMFRKTDQTLIVHCSNQKPILKNSIEFKVQQHGQKRQNSIHNFIMVGEFEHYIKQLKQTKYSQIYALTSLQAKQFTNLFPIFKNKDHKSALNKQNIAHQIKSTPLLIFLKQQLFKSSMNPIQKIFLHNYEFRNPKIYEQMRINQTINIAESITQKNKKQHYIKQLNKTKGNVLVIFNDNTNQQQLLSLFVTFIAQTFQIKEESALEYIGENLGKLKFSAYKHLDLQKQDSIYKIDQNQLIQIMQQLYQQSSSKAKVLQTYNLCLQTIDNISINPENQTYREIKMTDPRMHQSFKFKNSLKMLQTMGWKPQSEFWVNNLDIKHLKKLRASLQLAYAHFLGNEQKIK